MRAENGEKRALEADIRAARLELEVREREAEITRERCELLETVRASEKERAASCVRAVKAEQRAFETGSRAAQFDTERERAVGLTRERDELLEILKTAEEECAVSSMRAGKTEQRALEAESRAARLETEVRERVAESARERCEMLEGLRAAQADYSATSVRVDEAEKRAVEAETRAARLEIETRTRAAESTRERCELLEGLRAAKEECAATSVRAEKAERRALEVENRAAEVEKEEREREAQRSRERCELLERLRTAKRAKRSVRVANVEQTATAAKRRAAHVGNEEREKVLVGVTRERCELLGVMKTAKEARAATSVRAVKSEGRAIETKSRVARLNEACEHTDRLLERIKVGVTEDQLTSAADEIFLASEIWGGEKRGEASVEASLLSVGRESVQKPDCGSVGPLGKEGRFETGENGSACLVEQESPSDSATAGSVGLNMDETQEQAEESKAELVSSRPDKQVIEASVALATAKEGEREANGKLAARLRPAVEYLPDDLPIGLWLTASISAKQAAQRLPARSHRAFWKGLGFSPKQSKGRYTMRAYGTGRRKIGQSSKDFKVAFHSATKERMTFAQASVTADGVGST